MIRRILKWGLGVLLVLLAIPVLAVVAVLVLANTGPGRHLIESETASLTGGMVRIEGLEGRFPDRLRVARIEVSDAKGAYVSVSNIVLNWSPLRLLDKTAQVELLHAGSLDVSRLPESSGSQSSSTSSGFNLPVHVELRQLLIDRASIGAPIAGTAAVLALTGSAHIQSLQDGTVKLAAKRLDAAGTYAIDGTLASDRIAASVDANEPANGLISAVAHLPDLGPIAIKAVVNGPRTAVATDVAIKAGPLTASATGTVNTVAEAADLTLKAQAPAMAPAPGLNWQSLLVDAHVQGSLSAPIANGVARLAGLTAGGARVGTLEATVRGDTRQVDLNASVRDVHVPGPAPDLFAAAPITLSASAMLVPPDRPVTFRLEHALVHLEGSGHAAQQPDVQAHLVLPDLQPLAAAAGVALNGKADLNLHGVMQNGSTDATLGGLLSVTGGMAPVPALIGPDGHIDLAASLHGQDVTVSNLAVDGKALNVSATGGLVNQVLDANWQLRLTDVAAVQPTLSGNLSAAGHAQGKLDDLGLTADIGADLATRDLKPGHFDVHVVAEHLPKTPHANVSATGMLLDSPLAVALTADKSETGLKADIAQLSWKSLNAHGSATLLPNQTIPVGNLALSVGKLADFSPLIGRSVEGQADATLDSDQQAARLAATLQNISVPGTASLSRMVLNTTVTDPTGNAAVDATLAADGASASSVRSASARLSVKGPLDALALSLTGNAGDLAGGPAKIAAAGTADAKSRSLNLVRLETTWKDQAVRLLQPAKLNFTDGVAVDKMRLGYRQAELAVAGQVGSSLDLTATLRNLSADVAAVASPSLAANGAINADVRLTGTPARPEGTIKLTAEGVRLQQGPGAALPAANLNATIGLAGTVARVNTRLVAGPSQMTVTGTAPINDAGVMNLRTDGNVDLAMLDPILTAQGRRARGIVTLNATVAGTPKAPQVQGTATLRNGSMTDYTYGANITALNALVEASGNTIRLTHLEGKAGPGTLGGSGTIALNGAMPVDLHFTANNARPLSSDLLTALINADLTVRGDVQQDMQASGTLFVKQANIQIPDKLPTSVAVLPVRDPDAPPPPPQPATTSNINLDLTVNAPEQVFVRGRGLFAEVGGKIHIGGTAAAPVPSGGLNLRRGQLTVIGVSLNFTEGNVSFTGGGLSDPSIHFVAQSQTSAITATLTVGGSAKNPKITLSSYPELPQDEILAQLLFNTSTSKLSPLQLAEIASALAELSGATSGFGDPLSKVRNALGLDRLAVGSDSTGNPTLEAGRYVARGVYVGAKQSASGGGSQATVQIDLYKGLKLETAAGTLANNATGNTAGTEGASVGLTYQFQY